MWHQKDLAEQVESCAEEADVPHQKNVARKEQTVSDVSGSVAPVLFVWFHATSLPLNVPVPGSSVGALLFMGGPADVARLVVAIVIDAIDRHAFGARAQLGKPLVERLETELDVGVGTFVVGLTPPLSLGVAAVGALVGGILLDTQAVFRLKADR